MLREVLIGEAMLGANSAEVLLNFLKELGRDDTAGVEVGPLASLLPRESRADLTSPDARSH